MLPGSLSWAMLLLIFFAEAGRPDTSRRTTQTSFLPDVPLMAIFVALHEKIDDEQDRIDVLNETLEKREEALKRLRELTLGQ